MNWTTTHLLAPFSPLLRQPGPLDRALFVLPRHFFAVVNRAEDVLPEHIQATVKKLFAPYKASQPNYVPLTGKWVTWQIGGYFAGAIRNRFWWGKQPPWAMDLDSNRVLAKNLHHPLTLCTALITPDDQWRDVWGKGTPRWQEEVQSLLCQYQQEVLVGVNYTCWW